jgi:hypothetical protein
MNMKPLTSDESRLLSLRSEIALTDGLALALGEFIVDLNFPPFLCIVVIVFGFDPRLPVLSAVLI